MSGLDEAELGGIDQYILQRTDLAEVVGYWNIPEYVGVLSEFGFNLHEIIPSGRMKPYGEKLPSEVPAHIYTRDSDEDYPELRLVIQDWNGIHCITESFPPDARYERGLQSFNEHDLDVLRGFLRGYMEEVKDLDGISEQ